MDGAYPMQAADGSLSDARQRPLRVDSTHPLPTSVPPIRKMEKSHDQGSGGTDGLARTASRRRRLSGAGQGQYESFPKPGPEAPEVPQGPPVSYREPPRDNSTAEVPYNNPASFSARARGEPTDASNLPNSSGERKFDSTQTTRQSRRGSTRRSSIPKPIASHTSPSQPHSPPTNHDASPRFPHPTSESAALQDSDTTYTQLTRDGGDGGEHIVPHSSGADSRRMSASGADPRKEWAVDRSPLQKLEGTLIDISKEEKRARVEEAEQLLRDRQSNTQRPTTKAEVDPALDRTSKREPTEAHRKKPNRESGRGIPRERPSASQGMEDPLYDPGHGHGYEQPQLSQGPEDTSTHMTGNGSSGDRSMPASSARRQNKNPVQRNVSRHEPMTEAYYNSSRVESDVGYNDTQPGQDYAQKPRMAQFDRHDATPRKGDVRFASQERSEKPNEIGRPGKQVPREQQGIYDHRSQKTGEENTAAEYGGRGDPIPRREAKSHDTAAPYKIPPQTAAGIAARTKVGFRDESTAVEAAPVQRQHRLSKLLNRGHKADSQLTDGYERRSQHIDDWRKASTARLTAAHFETVPRSMIDAPNKYNAWWDNDKSSRRAIADASGGDSAGGADFKHAQFDPPLYLQCGPLLRFTGLQRSQLQQTQQSRQSASTVDREVWRGSIMIVTVDSESDYSAPPLLEIFPEPMDLLPPPPHHVKVESDHDLPAAYLDPIAGLPKLRRDGGLVYVRPIEDLDHEKDLSRVENDDGLFEQTRTANVPTSYGRPNSSSDPSGQGSSRNGQSQRRRSQKPSGAQVKGARLHAEHGVTFWRFNIEIELTERQQRIGYRINKSASVGFYVPAQGQTMNMMFHSCNGFSMSVDPDTFSGPDPLWRDVLNNHQSRPFHVMIGGGDQIYNDRVMSETELFQEWLTIKNPRSKHQAPFTVELRDELEAFYLERYAMWFSQGLFGMANSQIPMINIWDDHDIIDGFGSYPHHFMSTPVFCGLGTVAFKYYMLFQHQTVADEGPAEEPSWLMGAAPGPYINELSRSLFMFLGKSVAFLGLDCRTERMRDEILSEATYDLAFDRCRREIVAGETKHLIVLLGVPIAYPRLNFLENVLTSRVMDPIKALARAGLLGGFINKFDGGVEILDDLDDHWTAKHHKQERNWFIQGLQELAAEKSIRVTILGGDVHLAAVGQFYSSPKLSLSKDRDHRYMPNVISSAIVNTPPPELMADILNKRDKKHYVEKDEKETLEDMIPMFTHDVDGKSRNNKRLLPRRNWCSIREYHPGSTPLPTPPDSEHSSLSQDSPQPPPNRLQRTLSLTRGDVKPGNLIRRLSGRARPSSPDYPISNQYQASPRMPTSPPHTQEDYFNQEPKRASTLPASHSNGVARHSSAPLPRPGNFQRRPTNMSEKAVLKGGADDVHEVEAGGHINLECGLDICINCEVDQKDPSGITAPYRLLVPALWYEGAEDASHTTYRKKGIIERFRSMNLGRNRKSGLARGQGQGEWGGSNGGTDSYTPSISESGGQYDKQMTPPQQQARPVISNPISVPRQEDRGYQGRRPSKADRMLGTADDHPPSQHRTNSYGNRGAMPAQARTNSYGDGGPGVLNRSSSTGNGRRNSGMEPFQPRPQRNQYRHDVSPDDHDGGIVLGQGAKVNSAGSRSMGPQGLQTGNGSVKMGMGEKIRSASGSMQRSGSRGYQSRERADEGVVLGRGEKVSSGGGYGQGRFQDDDDGGMGDGYGDYIESEDEERFDDGRKNGGGKVGKGYGGIDAYKEKSWRRFF